MEHECDDKALKEKIASLYKKKQGFETNRNLCVIVIAILIYNIRTAYVNDSPSCIFYIIMSVICVAVVGVGIYAQRIAYKIGAEIAVLRKQSDDAESEQ